MSEKTEAPVIETPLMKGIDQAILLAAIFTLVISGFTSFPEGFIFSFLALFSLIRSSWKTLSCTLICYLMVLYGWVAPESWNGAPIVGFLLPFLAATILLVFLARLVPEGKFFSWFHFGKIDRLSKTLIVLTSVLSSAALIAWAFWTNQLGLGEDFVRGFGNAPKVLIFCVYIPLFACLNAFAEEVVYRGFIQESLMRVFESPLLILVLQASAFAAVHFHGGFPNGYVGFGMVFFYGVMLGFLRMRTRGILAPILAHVVADAAIAILLVYLVK